MKTVKVFKLDPNAKLPTRNNPIDSGLDLYALESVYIPVSSTAKIKTGIAVNIPAGYDGKIEDRSGLAAKGLRTGAGVVDASYSGDLTVVMHNFSSKCHYDGLNSGYQINAGDKIAQLVIRKVELPEVEEVSELWTSDRGNKGFGSSGN